MKTKSPWIHLLGIVLLFTAVLQAQILTNGSFEAGGFTGWTTVVGSGFETVFSGPYYGGPSATDGTKMVVFNAGDAPAGAYLEQAFTTTLGQNYQVTFDFGNFNSAAAGNQSLIVTAFDQSSNTIASQTYYNSTLNGWDTGSLFSFMATTSSTTLRFTDHVVTTANEDSFLDHISVVPVAVPEPSSFLVLSGLLVIVFSSLVPLLQRRLLDK